MAHAVQNEEVRKYLIDKGVAPLLEQFTAEVISQRPDDVLAFLKQWAAEKYAMVSGVADAERENAQADGPSPAELDTRDPLEVVAESWKKYIRASNLQSAVVEKFFSLLFVQKPLFQRTLFEGVDIKAAVAKAVPLVDLAMVGGLHDAVLIEFCKENTIGKGVEEKHFSSFHTAFHAAVAATIGAEHWESLNVPWNKYIRELSVRIQNAMVEAEDIYRVESGVEPAREADSDDEDGVRQGDTRSAKEIVKESWSKLPSSSQKHALEGIYNVLLTQHSILKQGPLQGIEIDEFVTLIAPTFEKIANGVLVEADARNTRFVQVAVALDFKPKHLDYMVTAALSSLSKIFGGQWTSVSAAYSQQLTAAAQLFTKVAFP